MLTGDIITRVVWPSPTKYLAKDAQAGDSDTLDGQHGAYYTEYADTSAQDVQDNLDSYMGHNHSELHATQVHIGKPADEAVGRGLLMERVHDPLTGEGNSRIMWTENNDSSYPLNNVKYGISWNYQGDTGYTTFPSGATAVVNGNATWALKRHDGNTDGVAIMSGSRDSNDVDFAGAITTSGYSIFTGVGIRNNYLNFDAGYGISFLRGRRGQYSALDSL